MNGCILDDEIGIWGAGSTDLRANSGIVGNQLTVRECRKIAPNRPIEFFAPPWLDTIIDGLNPLDIGSKASLSAEVERQMNAEAAGLGHRVDQSENGAVPTKRK